MSADVFLHFESLLRSFLTCEDPFYVAVERIKNYPVYEEESRYISGAVDRRKMEYSTGRWLARKALEHLGIDPQPIHKGALHQPLWPEGIIGSLTHEMDLCAAVLIRKQRSAYKALGIDIAFSEDSFGPASQYATEFLTGHDEIDSIPGIDKMMDPYLALLCLKESGVKAISESMGDFLDIRAIRFDVSISPCIKYQEHMFPMRYQIEQCGAYLLSSILILE